MSLTTRTINDADEAREFLLAAGTKPPSNHPRAGRDARTNYSAWNGWNFTKAVGMNANGFPIELDIMHFASGSIHFSSGSGTLLSSDHEKAWAHHAFPLEMLPAVPIIAHPQYTPED